MIFYLVEPQTNDDIRGARSYLRWTQPQLADKCGCSTGTIISLENGKHLTNRNVIAKLTEVFSEAGIKFLLEGGFKRDNNIVQIFEGKEGAFKILNDIIKTCDSNRDELLFFGNDDKRSSEEVNKLHKKIYAIGISYKYLIAEDNDYILGPLEDYRQINSDSFFSKDAIVIYKNKITFCVKIESDLKSNKVINRKYLIINDRDFAETFKNYFYRLWKKGIKPKKSSVKQIFFKKNV